MSDLLMLVEWTEENFEIIELSYDKGCHCYDFTITMEYYDFILKVCGIAYLDGDISNRVTISSDFNDKEVEIDNFAVGTLDTIKQGFIKKIEDDDFWIFE